MIRYRFIYQTILLGGIFFSCTNEEANIFTVSGHVYYLGEPIEDVTVSIDDQYNWTVGTDADGFFHISSVSSGEHQLNMKKHFHPFHKVGRDRVRVLFHFFIRCMHFDPNLGSSSAERVQSIISNNSEVVYRSLLLK